MGIETYSKTPGNNNAAPPNGAPEGMPPSAVNDIIRQNMADLRAWYEAPQWINYGSAGLVFYDAANFKVTGDQTATYTVGRRVKAIDNTATLYGTITASVYSSPTTQVTVALDSGTFDVNLTQIALGPDFAGKAFTALSMFFPAGSVPYAAISNPIIPVPPGLITPYAFLTLPSEATYGAWLFVGGNTIGDASSGGTARANADVLNLFTGLYNSFSNTVLPLQDSTGTAVARGASAAADFAAHRRLPLLDTQHRIIAGLGGGSVGTSPVLLTSPVNGNTIGAKGGEEGHSLSAAEGPNSTFTVHGIDQGVSTGTPQVGVGRTQSRGFSSISGNSAVVTATLDGAGNPFITSDGAGTAHNNVQPTLILPYIIKV